MVYMDRSPNFEKVIRIHTAAKKSALNEFKQQTTAATLLGISEKVFARITGAVLVANDDDGDWMRKVNIGLQLKVRSLVSQTKIRKRYLCCVTCIHIIIIFGLVFLVVSIGHCGITRFCETKRQTIALLTVRN